MGGCVVALSYTAGEIDTPSKSINKHTRRRESQSVLLLPPLFAAAEVAAEALDLRGPFTSTSQAASRSKPVRSQWEWQLVFEYLKVEWPPSLRSQWEWQSMFEYLKVEWPPSLCSQ